MVVGVCRLSLYFPESGSLKSKRHLLRKVIDRSRAKFNLAISEVADQDTWQRATLGLCVVGNEGRHVRSMVDNILAFVEELYVGQVISREVDILQYGDEEPFAEDMPSEGRR